MNKTATLPTTLVMRHTFKAPIERVYEAWTTPEVMIVMRLPDGEEYVSYGTYRELVPPAKILCTQQWEEDDKALERETVLTLEFRSLGPQSTELTLTHENFRDVDQRDRHAHGWGGCFVKLDAFLG